jgi:ACS family D-galactonate transporter-like MFS transporter
MSAQDPLPGPPASSETPLDVIHRRRWSIVGLLFTASLINYFDRATLSFALPLISRDFHLAPTAKGALSSAFFWSYALMQIPIGLCADRVNLRWLYAGAFALWSFSQGLTGMATSLGMLIVFRVMLGVGEAIYLPGGTKIVSLMFVPSERGFPCGLIDFGTRSGLVLEGLLVPWMLQKLGWPKTFMIVGFTAFLWLVPWFLVAPKTLKSRAPLPATMNAAAFLAGLRSLVANRNLVGICLGFFCFDYYWYLLLTWLPDYLVEVRHFDIIKAGFFASLPFVVFGLCQPLGGWIGDRLSRAGWNETRVRKGLITIAFLTGLFLIPAAKASNPYVAIGFIMAGSLVGLSTANQIVILQHCAPQDKIGLWTGVYNFIGNIAGITAPILTGFLIEKTGSYTSAFVFAAVMVPAGALSYWFIVRELPRKAAAVIA